MEKDYIKEQNYLKAKKRVQDIKGFYSHLAVYIIINIFISGVIIYGLSHDSNHDLPKIVTNFGVYSTWIFWGIGLFFHWLGVFGFKSFLGKKWEEKKIKELMDEENNRSNKILKK
jgi:hypothetical protein